MCRTEEDEGPSTEEDSPSFQGVGVCKWFNVRMGFGFLSMNSREGVPLDEPVDVFVHQVGRATHAQQRCLTELEQVEPTVVSVTVSVTPKSQLFLTGARHQCRPQKWKPDKSRKKNKIKKTSV